MRHAAVVAVLTLAAAASARAVTFTRITSCCLPREFGVTQPAWSSDPDKIAFTYANDYAGHEVWVAIGVIAPTGVPVDGYYPDANFTAHASWAPDATRFVCQLGGTAPGPLRLGSSSSVKTHRTCSSRTAPARAAGVVSRRRQGRLRRLGRWQRLERACCGWHAGPRHDARRLRARVVGGRSAHRVLARGRDAAADRNPSWGPDSQRIAFESTRDGNPNIWIASDFPDFTVAIARPTWTALKHLYR